MDRFDRMLATPDPQEGRVFHDPGYFTLALSVFGGRQGWVA